MSAQRLAVILFGGLAVVLFLLGRWFDHDYESRSPQILADMADSPAYDAQEPNPVFADGRTLRLPPEGAVARGFDDHPFPPGKDGIVAAGAALVAPALDPRRDLPRGADVYGRICAVCHGPQGDGDGAVTKRGVPAPPSLLAENARKLTDGAIYHVITTGFNNMPAHAAQVSAADRWRVIGHIRELQRSRP